MGLVGMGSLGDLVRGSMDLVDRERQQIIDWLRAHENQHERAIEAGACVRGSTAHGELRDQAAYYGAVADALEAKKDSAWTFGLVGDDEWVLPKKQSERTGA